MCGAVLKERKKRGFRLPSSDIFLPLLLLAGLALLWLWKPWESPEPLAMVPALSPSPATATPAATGTPAPSPTATYYIAPTATPLHSPTPSPSPTLPPNQTVHIVQSGETVSTIAKKYGATTGAVLRANGLKSDSIISPEAVLDRVIVDKNVVVGKGTHLGFGEDYTPNQDQPQQLRTGISLVGKNTHLPPGIIVGRNVVIGSDLPESLIPRPMVSSGRTIDVPSSEKA